MSNKMNPILIMTFLMMMNGCAHKEKADMILVNGQIYTVDSVFSVKQAFAVTGGMFAAVGSNDEIMAAYESDLIIDANGKAVTPGLIDGHCHFLGYASNQYNGINLRGTHSFDEIMDLLITFHQQNPQSWIVGFGWDQNDWDIKEFPDNFLLDQNFPYNPVVLVRIDGHAVLANSKALQQVNIKPDTKISGGKILLKDGKPTGILLDNAADILRGSIPQPDTKAKKNALKEAQHECFSLGLTSLADAGVDYLDVLMIDSMQMEGTLKMKVNAMLSPTRRNLDEFVKKGPFQKERLTVNSVKLYADGALGSRGALLLEPYSDDPGNYGLRMSEPEYFRQIIALAYEKGFQVNTHCIGDSANRMMLHLYGEALKGTNDRRWRIEHAQVIHPDDFKLFAEYNIIPSVQATHCTSDMYWAGERLGPDRVKGAYAYKMLLQQNGWLINGTDFPVEHINPLLTFYAAVSRMDKEGYPANGFQMENALTREEALRSMTIWAAKGSFEEELKGSIETGKYADFIILDKDIMEVEMSDIPKTRVLKTYVNGDLVFE